MSAIVICPICGKEFHNPIPRAHIRFHEITTLEFSQKYPGVKFDIGKWFGDKNQTPYIKKGEKV